jgi:hypothetical protein
MFDLSQHYEGVVPLFTFYAVPLLTIAVLMFCMTLYKCSQHLLGVGSAARMPVITLFLRDGVFFFFAVLCEHLWAISLG